MIEPGRSYTANNSSYRYGFNGKEKDQNITSEDYDYGFRIYDVRVVRFLSVDPITSEYPELTPYQFASNRFIDGIDIDGLEYATFTISVQNGKVTAISVAKDYDLKNPHTAGPGVQLNYVYLDKTGKTERTEIGKNTPNTVYGIYGGDANPQLPDIGGDPKTSLHDDYRLAPIDELDALTLKHDHRYDNLDPKKTGLKGVMNNSTTPANDEAINESLNIYARGVNGDKDKITGKQITANETAGALKIAAGFQAAEDIKAPIKGVQSVFSTIGNFFHSVGGKFEEIKEKAIEGLNSVNNVAPKSNQ